MNFGSLDFLVLAHGLVEFVFALVFVLEGLKLLLLWYRLKHGTKFFLSSVNSKATSLFAEGIATFASYEVTFSSYPQKLSDDVTGRKVRKNLYHIIRHSA